MSDVTVRYNNEAIVELSDSGTKILKTKDTICEDDIEVEYTKPSGGISAPEITFDIDSENISDAIYNGSPFFRIVNNEGLQATYAQATNYMPRKVGSDYSYQFRLLNSQDNLTITVNNENVVFSNDAPAGYAKNIIFGSTPGNVTVVIRDKN